jgi:SAM-dependent methyltransferase
LIRIESNNRFKQEKGCEGEETDVEGGISMTEPATDLVREAKEELARYLAEWSAEAAYRSYSPLKLLLRLAVPKPLRPTARRLRPAGRRVATGLLVARERRRARAFRRRPQLLLHLGCGSEIKGGWVNVDLFGPRFIDLAWNLTRGLPFDDASVDGIFHEHVLEHFTLSDGFALTQECHRVLREGGVLRIGVPNAADYVLSYLEGGRGFIESVRPGRPTPLLAMQEVFYEYGHRTMYDFETLEFLCNAAGFMSVVCRRFGETRLPQNPDSASRRLETLYVETVR